MTDEQIKAHVAEVHSFLDGRCTGRSDCPVPHGPFELLVLELRASRTREAEARKQFATLRTAAANVCLAFHDWPEYASPDCQAERQNSINALAEAAGKPREDETV